MNRACQTCTRQLVMLAYQRSPWLRIMREPLKFSMRAWVRLAAFDLEPYYFATPHCRDCNRPYKNALKERSAAFRFLNRLINPWFDRVLERVLGEQAIEDAQARASARDETKPPEEMDRWVKILTSGLTLTRSRR